MANLNGYNRDCDASIIVLKLLKYDQLNLYRYRKYYAYDCWIFVINTVDSEIPYRDARNSIRLK